MHHEKRPAKPRAATSCPGSTQSWATRAQRYSSTRASKPRYIQAPRRHRKGKPPTHLARPTAPAGSARPRAGPTLPQLRHRARSTKHPPGRRAAQLRSATVRRPQKLHGAPRAEATANAAIPAPTQTRHTSTAETQSDTTTAPRRAQRQRGHPTPKHKKRPQSVHKEPKIKRKKQRRRSAPRRHRPRRCPTRRNHTTDCAAPAGARTRARRRRGATPGGADAAQHSKSRIWRPLAAASVCGSRATYCGGLACHGGPRVGPHTLTPCRSTPYRRCRGRHSSRGQD